MGDGTCSRTGCNTDTYQKCLWNSGCGTGQSCLGGFEIMRTCICNDACAVGNTCVTVEWLVSPAAMPQFVLPLLAACTLIAIIAFGITSSRRIGRQGTRRALLA